MKDPNQPLGLEQLDEFVGALKGKTVVGTWRRPVETWLIFDDATCLGMQALNGGFRIRLVPFEEVKTELLGKWEQIGSIVNQASKALGLPQKTAPSEQHRCAAHGNAACKMCSRTLPGGLMNKACRGCDVFEGTGMHCVSCAFRDGSDLGVRP